MSSKYLHVLQWIGLFFSIFGGGGYRACVGFVLDLAKFLIGTRLRDKEVSPSLRTSLSFASVHGAPLNASTSCIYIAIYYMNVRTCTT